MTLPLTSEELRSLSEFFVTPPDPPIPDVLRKALDILSGEDSWCKGVLQDDEGRHCVMGAINIAQTGRARYGLNNYDAVAAVLYPHLPREFQGGSHFGGTNSVVHYNNDPNTTVEDIRLLLKSALVTEETKAAMKEGRGE